MAFKFKPSFEEEAVKDYEGSGGKYINTGGIYEVILKHVIVSTSANGAESLDFWIEHKNQTQPIYQGIRLTNNNGEENLEAKAFNKLFVVCGGKENQEVNDPVSKMVPMGKGGSEVECMVLEDFDDTPIYIRIQMEYSLWENKIQERKLVRNYFRFEDKATASEIINNVKTKGAQFEKESSYEHSPKYNNGLTKEDVDEWLKNRQNNKRDNTEKTPKNGFSSKNRFSKS